MFCLIALMFLIGVVFGLQIGDYPDITNTTDCGIGRESQLMTDRCFEWHSSRDLMNTSSSLSSIVNGRDAKRAELPYIVYIEKWKDNDNTRCTGTVLNQHWILTAAHCYEECDNCLYKIYAGIIDIRYPGIDYGINKVIKHENNSDCKQWLLLSADKRYLFADYRSKQYRLRVRRNRRLWFDCTS
ncbi:serine protease 52-like [Oppia nitens]|uniref:serine protease 52-like n=1 Tax=Oppia nitens TaxID=1686743 RepID=UPI0023DB2B91|nr:serine protease 52-like [Oppia nitens]